MLAVTLLKGAAICLLDHGADINASDNAGFMITPLMTATQLNQISVVDLFLGIRHDGI